MRETSGVTLEWEIIRLGSAKDGHPTGEALVEASRAMTDASASRRFNHVAVLLGGLSAEREVSLDSGPPARTRWRAPATRSPASTPAATWPSALAEVKPEVCFNALHGRWGEDGCVQGLLELLGIPYTHSGVLASALAMHKERAKDVMHAAGVPVPDGKVVRRAEAAKAHVLPRPYVLKPVSEGSSVGVYIVREDHAASRPRSCTIRAGPSGTSCWPSATFPDAS